MLGLLMGSVGYLADDVHLQAGGGPPGSGGIQTLVNWAGQYGLYAALAGVVIGAILFVMGSRHGFTDGAATGRGMMEKAGIAAAVLGIAPTAINLVFHAFGG